MQVRVVKLPGGNRVDIVGESFYGKAIRDVIAMSGKGADLWASLVPDPANPIRPERGEGRH